MKFYYKTLAFASLLALAACSDFDEMNTNPYEPPYSPGTSNTDVSPEGIDIDYELPEADIKALKEAETSIGSLFRNLTNEGPYNDYQVTTNLTHDIYAGYMANTSAGFHEKACTYVYTDDWSRNRWIISIMTVLQTNMHKLSKSVISSIKTNTGTSST